MSERTGLVEKGDVALTLVGTPVDVGDQAPAFHAIGTDGDEVSYGDFTGRVSILVAVPSLDTDVCDRESRRFNEEADGLGEGVRVIVVSMDLPPAQARWCAGAGIDALTTVSDHRDASFGTSYGVLIKELRLLARSVFVVGPDGVVRHVQIVDQLGTEPDYDAVLQAARSLL